MSPLEISRIETEAGKLMPAEYRDFLIRVPDEIGDWAQDGYLLLDASAIIFINHDVRQGPVYGIDWPDKYFIIGQDGLGDYFCLDLTKSPSPVLFFDHEQTCFTKQAGSVDHWWQAQLDDPQNTRMDGEDKEDSHSPIRTAKEEKLVVEARAHVQAITAALEAAHDLPSLRQSLSVIAQRLKAYEELGQELRFHQGRYPTLSPLLYLEIPETKPALKAALRQVVAAVPVGQKEVRRLMSRLANQNLI